MLNSIRNFSKTITAKIFLFIVAVPFVFWGMGDVFTSGNTNSLAKVNNENISTEDFIDHINELNINQNLIKDRLENNILEEVLSRLISNKLIELEIKEANLVLSDKILAEKIKTNSNFLDEDLNFSRTKYEKFLLSNNLTASQFERNFKENEFQEELFNYLGGGIKSPNFLVYSSYEDETKKINIEFINLENNYSKKENIGNDDVKNYINENKEKLKKDYIDFSYSKVIPKDLIGLDDYNNEFFTKIDEIESKLLNNVSFKDTIQTYNLKSISKNNFIPQSDNETIETKIYNLRNNEKTGIIDESDFFVIYEITKIENKIPNLNNSNFVNQIKQFIFNKNKFEFNKKILKKINDNNFFDSDFNELVSGKNKIEKMLIKSKNDVEKFSSESLEVIYSLPIKSFALIADNEKNIYLVKILNHKVDKILDNNELKNIYYIEANNLIKNKIFQSYDVYLNSKYTIKINEKTLERVKNYFR
ncbi:SurA N-terminal domain-containing protein [Candidatus Pelagibacter sp.]|nr:SurA N-terminal domain-containing protein [Candidatus Pelagibacter sp.]